MVLNNNPSSDNSVPGNINSNYSPDRDEFINLDLINVAHYNSSALRPSISIVVPTPKKSKYSKDQLWLRQIYFGFKVAVTATLFLYLSIPVMFRFSPSFQRHLVFLPFVRWPHGVNFNDPSSEGIEGGRNIYLEPEPKSTFGVWHFLPSSQLSTLTPTSPPSVFDNSLKNSGCPIVIYMHGNSGSRAGAHRKELYTLLQSLDYHVIALDYRGYADSTHEAPSERTVVVDGIFVYKWIRGIVGAEVEVYIWGHSLGTGVSSHVVSKLCLEGNPPSALILESPFTSIGEEVKHHMLASLWRYMPFFDSFFVHPLKANDFAFETDSRIGTIPIPILILHAVDDPVVPYFLGKKLYEIGVESRGGSRKTIYFQGFGEGFAHKFICRSPDLPRIITTFFNCTTENKWPSSLLEETKIHQMPASIQ